METRLALRATISTFLIGLAVAFMITLGLRLSGWSLVGPAMKVTAVNSVGLSIIASIVALALGVGLSAYPARDFRNALMGVSLVLLAIPLSEAVILQQWTATTSIVIALGFAALASGVLMNQEGPDARARNGAEDAAAESEA